jgi:hypothetical protein
MIPEIQRLRKEQAAALNNLFEDGRFAGIAAAQTRLPAFDPRQPMTNRAAKMLGASNAWHHWLRRPLAILKG